MSDRHSGERRDDELAMNIFAVSSGMVGVCLTGVGLMRVGSALDTLTHVGDDLLAIDALLFLVACLFSFSSFRLRNARRRGVARIAADAVFLVALGLMVVICCIITYAVI
jgi:hypothetical protein